MSTQILAPNTDRPQAVGWKPGRGPLPTHLEQAAWRLYQADQRRDPHPPIVCAGWADLPSTVRDAYRRRVMDRLQAWSLGTAETDLTLVLAWLLVGHRDVPDALYTELSAIAETALARMSLAPAGGQ